MANVSFFGIEIEPGKEEVSPIPSGIVLHVSTAAFAKAPKNNETARVYAVIEDTDDTDDEEDQNNVSGETTVKREFAIGTLVAGSHESISFDLNFSEIDGDVSFKVVGGSTPVHLTGFYNQIVSDEDMFGDFDGDDEDLPPNFAQYESDDEEGEPNLKQLVKGDVNDDSSDDEFAPNESALNESSDSGHFIPDEDDEDDDKLQAQIQQLKTQINNKDKKRKAGQSQEEKPAKKQKTETPKKEAAKKQETPKKEQTPAKKEQTPAKQPEQQSGKKSGKKNKKNKKSKKNQSK